MRIATGALAAVCALTLAVPAGAQQAKPQQTKPWYKLPWNPANVKPCDRQCLVDIGESYLKALQTKDQSGVPYAEGVIATENTGHIAPGIGLLWRARIEPTPFKITVADPVNGQIAFQTVLKVDGRPALVAIRLKVERRMITEIEQDYDRDVAPEAMELLRTPRPNYLNDVPKAKQESREYLQYAAESYFDALTGEDGSIAPFADECVRHEQGYQTVNNKTPGRAAPSPALPDLKTEQGRLFSKLSMMTCKQQIDSGIFSGIKRIWPHRALVIDQQKGLVATFPFFVHDGLRHVDGQPPAPPAGGGAGMTTNLTTMETFAIRDGKIYGVEAFPFVLVPYGRTDGWTNADPN
jgi:hypothetical protein